LPLVSHFGSIHPEALVYSGGEFASYLIARLEGQLCGWVAAGIPRVKMKIGTIPDEDPKRVAFARRAIGDCAELYVDANDASPRKPALAIAAVEVLEVAGFQVVVPKPSVCRGRPLFDFGILEAAQGLWLKILAAFRPEIEADTPLVGLEPSCVAAFRDELLNLYPMNHYDNFIYKNTIMLFRFLI
jgi:Fe-S oxidoreductase